MLDVILQSLRMADTMLPVDEGWCLGNDPVCSFVWWCGPSGYIKITVLFTSLWLANFYFVAWVLYPFCEGWLSKHPSTSPKETGRYWFAWHIQSVTHSTIVVVRSFPAVLALMDVSMVIQNGVPTPAFPAEWLPAVTSLGNNCSIFWCFLLADCFTSIVHRLGGVDNVIHHIIFVLFCAVVSNGCFAGHLGGSMLLMEVSTVPLNFFTYFRHREGFGKDSFYVQGSFVLFFLGFVVFRLLLFPWVALRFVKAAQFDGVFPTTPQWQLMVICAGMVCACILQVFWFVVIVRKLIPMVRSLFFSRKEDAEELKQE